VFDQATGAAATRSDRLVAQLAERLALPGRGRWLDVGCGNGGFLGSFARRFPGWTLAGTEYDAKYRAEVEAIPGVERLYTGELSEVPGEFDAISLIHVLEHIEGPRAFLAKVREKLRPGGWLVVELPHYADNPFELLIADHATHYGLETASALLESAGFRIELASDCAIPKELTLVARKEAPQPGRTPAAVREVGPMIEWLASVAADARRVASGAKSFGLFGTSIAGTWLYGEVADVARFFVDEDPDRAGREHFGLPIHAPAQVPAGSDVYVGLPPAIARAVSGRLGREGVRYHAAPEAP
jgi:SAM-dependent methyltransferase